MKNPTILEGGIARVFSGIRKLFTRQSGSDDMITWVPESDRTLGTIYITKNGVYKAKDYGYYAFSSATVNVPTDTGVTGEGEDGEQHYVAPDPETGELVDEVLADHIVVTASAHPNYRDGDTIDFTGVEVTAYLATGEIWEDENHPDGVVPVSELVFPVTIAQYDPDSPIEGQVSGGLLPQFGLDTIPTFLGTLIMTNTYNETITIQCLAPTFLYEFPDSSLIYGYAVSDTLNALVAKVTVNGITSEIYATSEATYNNKTAYYSGFGGFDYWRVPPSTINASYTKLTTLAGDFPKLIWSMLYGDVETQGNYTVPVEWARNGPGKGDGAVLESSFQIFVSP